MNGVLLLQVHLQSTTAMGAHIGLACKRISIVSMIFAEQTSAHGLVLTR